MPTVYYLVRQRDNLQFSDKILWIKVLLPHLHLLHRRFVSALEEERDMENRHTKEKRAEHHPEFAVFIQQTVVPAQQSEFATGVPASITIAQAILESGWGKRHMGNANNYFGIKAQVDKSGGVSYGTIASGYVDFKTKEHFEGQEVYINAHFRAYRNMADSFVDHGLFLRNNPRYHCALEDYARTLDADEFARALQKAGYATDPRYAELLITIMKKNNLYQYNRRSSNT